MGGDEILTEAALASMVGEEQEGMNFGQIHTLPYDV